MTNAYSVSSLFGDSRFLGWLAAAMLAHALLLLIPSQRDRQSGEALPTLAIALLRASPPAPTAVAPMPQEPPAEPARERPRSASPEAQMAESSPTPNPRPEPPVEPLPERPKPSTAYLLDLAGRQRWSLPETSAARILGEHTPRPATPNWRPARSPEAHHFGGRVAPAQVEIVDRWLAADGSHNVVITAPDGETYCGRAEAWNPLTPLVEPIMTYRNCGGGQRSFDMPHPYRRNTADGERP